MTFSVQGAEPAVRAALDARARRSLVALRNAVPAGALKPRHAICLGIDSAGRLHLGLVVHRKEAVRPAVGPIVRAVLAVADALRELAERTRGEARRAAEQAILRIQARLPGATPGQLSIADGDGAGHVSLAPDKQGAVSVEDR